MFVRPMMVASYAVLHQNSSERAGIMLQPLDVRPYGAVNLAVSDIRPGLLVTFQTQPDLGQTQSTVSSNQSKYF